MKPSKSACLLRIFLVVLTFGIFASSLTSLVINPDIKLEVTTAIVFGITIISFLNIVAIRELQDPTPIDTSTKIGLWANLGVFNLAVMFLVSKFGFQLF